MTENHNMKTPDSCAYIWSTKAVLVCRVIHTSVTWFKAYVLSIWWKTITIFFLYISFFFHHYKDNCWAVTKRKRGCECVPMVSFLWWVKGNIFSLLQTFSHFSRLFSLKLDSPASIKVILGVLVCAHTVTGLGLCAKGSDLVGFIVSDGADSVEHKLGNQFLSVSSATALGTFRFIWIHKHVKLYQTNALVERFSSSLSVRKYLISSFSSRNRRLSFCH